MSKNYLACRGRLKYTDCIHLKKSCFRYDKKPSDGEIPILEIQSV